MRTNLVLTSVVLLASLWCAPEPPAATRQQPAKSARTSPVAVGEVAPDFTLGDQSGRKVTLSEARGKQPVVLVFYRGYW
jgi:cytochrome oxidase Cu insertion factor (SCO1/SenC/PrrC family)